jgi:hypothetical protein
MVLAALTVRAQMAEAVVTEVTGSACGYISNVGLFQGPQAKLGCAPQVGTGSAPAGPNTLAPSVALPPGGSDVPITATDANGAVAQYGPARIFAGRWPCITPAGNCPLSAPPSGPLSVSTVGTPASGTVNSSTDIVLFSPPQPEVPCSTTDTSAPVCFAPGGVGPWPAEADEVHVSCTASETAITGTTTFVNAELAHAADSIGNPTDVEQIPANPPVNMVEHGIISNVGDVFTIVFNEQVINADGSLTVNGMHMYLFGPTAVGEVIKGQATCGVTPSPLSPADDTVPPTCGEPTLVVTDPNNPVPVDPQQVQLGLFDASGLQSVTITNESNVTVRIGTDPSSSQAYLRFTPGQTGPLVLYGTRTDPSLPTSWSFTATDAQGKETTGTVTGTAEGVPIVLDAVCESDVPPPSTTTTTSGGGTTTTTGGGGTTTTTSGGGTTTTTSGGGTTTTTSGGNTTTTSGGNTTTTSGGNTTTTRASTTTTSGGGGTTTTTAGTGGGTGGGGTTAGGGTAGGGTAGGGTGALARTGRAVLPLIEVAVALLLSGWAAAMAGRRREPTCLRAMNRPR